MSKKKRNMGPIEAVKAPALEPQLAKQIEEELSTLD
jgi:hypothetical protein